MSLLSYLKQRIVWEVGAIATALTILGFYASQFRNLHGLVVNGQPLFGDFIAFWSAGRLALAGHADQVHDTTVLFHQHLVAIPGLHVVAPWNSPPPFLIVSELLALLPYPAAAVVFLLMGGTLFLYMARQWLPDARALIFAATVPAAVYEIGTVQVGLVIAGLTGLALFFLDKRPRLSGALVGLLVIKPHLALMWPLFLGLSRRWNTFAAAAATAIIFCLLGALFYGPDSYVRFYHNLTYAYSLISDKKVAIRTFASLYGNLRAFGVPYSLALSLHALNAACAVALASWVFWKGEIRAQGAALCAATMMMSPYLFFYDSTILAVGAALIWPPRNKFEAFAVLLGWGAGLTVSIGQYLPLPICPMASWCLLISALARTVLKTPAENVALHPEPALST